MINTLHECVFRYGQLSGMVEPVAGLFGTIAVVVSLSIPLHQHTKYANDTDTCNWVLLSTVKAFVKTNTWICTSFFAVALVCVDVLPAVFRITHFSRV